MRFQLFSYQRFCLCRVELVVQHLVVVWAQAYEVLARVVPVVAVQVVQLHALVKAADDAGFRHFLPELKRNVVVLADVVTFCCFILFPLLWITKYAHPFPVVVLGFAADLANYYWRFVAPIAILAAALGPDYYLLLAFFAYAQDARFSLHACAIFSGLFKERDRAACR